MNPEEKLPSATILPFPTRFAVPNAEAALGEEQNARQLFLTAFLALGTLERHRARGTADARMLANGIALAHAALGRLLERGVQEGR